MTTLLGLSDLLPVEAKYFSQSLESKSFPFYLGVGPFNRTEDNLYWDFNMYSEDECKITGYGSVH